MLSVSSVTRREESIASTFAISSLLIAANPGRFLSWASNSVSKRVHPRRQRGSTLPELFRANQAEGRILGEGLGVIHVLIARHPAVHGVPDQAGEEELRVQAPRVGQMLGDEVAEPQPFVKLS